MYLSIYPSIYLSIYIADNHHAAPETALLGLRRPRPQRLLHPGLQPATEEVGLSQ